MSRNNNIDQHISDAASSVTIDPSTTVFPSTVTDLQKLASAIDAHALTALPTATEAVYGVVKIASQGEVNAGVVSDAIVTPATLQQRLTFPNATTTVYGLTKYGTGSELTFAGKSDSVSVSTNGMWTILRTNAQATEAARGTMAISTAAAARAGTDNTTAMTPYKVKLAIDTFAVTNLPGANENTTGTVKIAAVPVINAGYHNGFAVSPKGFIETRATETRVGTTLIATQAQANAGTDNTVVLTPANAPTASYTQRGLVQLQGSAEANRHDRALSAHGGQQIVNYANTTFVKRSGDTMSGALTAPYMYSNVGQQTAGNSLVRLDYLNSRLNGLTISRALHRGYMGMGWNAWYDLGTVYFNSVSSWLGCRVVLPVFAAENSGNGCRPHYHFSIQVVGSTGHTVTQVVSRIYVPHDKYGNGLAVHTTPMLTFPMPPGTTWVRVLARAHDPSCMSSPRLHDGMVIFTGVPY